MTGPHPSLSLDDRLRKLLQELVTGHGRPAGLLQVLEGVDVAPASSSAAAPRPRSRVTGRCHGFGESIDDLTRERINFGDHCPRRIITGYTFPLTMMYFTICFALPPRLSKSELNPPSSTLHISPPQSSL